VTDRAADAAATRGNHDRIPEPEAKAIVAYLKRHYTPETRKE